MISIYLLLDYLKSLLFYNNNAKYNEEVEYLKVGQGSPCPVLQHPIELYKDRHLGVIQRPPPMMEQARTNKNSSFQKVTVCSS